MAWGEGGVNSTQPRLPRVAGPPPPPPHTHTHTCELHGDGAVLEPLVELHGLQARHLAQLSWRQRVELHHLVDAVQELGPAGSGTVGLRVVGWVGRGLSRRVTESAGEHQQQPQRAQQQPGMAAGAPASTRAPPAAGRQPPNPGSAQAHRGRQAGRARRGPQGGAHRAGAGAGACVRT